MPKWKIKEFKYLYVNDYLIYKSHPSLLTPRCHFGERIRQKGKLKSEDFYLREIKHLKGSLSDGIKFEIDFGFSNFFVLLNEYGTAGKEHHIFRDKIKKLDFL